MSELKPISPIDSRYHKFDVLRDLCSYESQIMSKIFAEFSWFIFLCNKNDIGVNDIEFNELLSDLYGDFDNFYSIERVTKHDIKAVEYYIKSIVEKSNFYNTKSQIEKSKILSYIHFGLTSQDIVSLATNELISKISYELTNSIKRSLNVLYDVFGKNSVLMVGLTHGQPAVPINSKLIYDNYNERILTLVDKLLNIQPKVKFGGAVGNNSSMKLIGIRDIDELMDEFIDKFNTPNTNFNIKLKRSKNTTQVDNWIYLVDLLKEYLQLSSIYIDLCRDLWHYCSINYLYQDKSQGQIGSSTMVQKTNPINFENCEGIMEKLESDFSFYIKKFSKSRLQRDLSDSVVIRMVFESFAMFDVAINSLLRGLTTTSLNEKLITSELNNHYEVSAEYIQLFMKNKGISESYEIILERLKQHKLTDKDSYENFITNLLLDEIITKDMHYIMTQFDLSDYKKI